MLPWKIIKIFPIIISKKVGVIRDILKVKVDLVCLGGVGGVIIKGHFIDFLHVTDHQNSLEGSY